MKGRRILHFMIVLIGLAIVLGGPMSACAEKAVTFRVIGLFDLTGPYASIHSIIQKGIADFIDWANKEPGYFPEGVQWSHEVYDTGTDIGIRPKRFTAGNRGDHCRRRPRRSSRGGDCREHFFAGYRSSD